MIIRRCCFYYSFILISFEIKDILQSSKWSHADPGIAVVAVVAAGIAVDADADAVVAVAADDRLGLRRRPKESEPEDRPGWTASKDASGMLGRFADARIAVKVAEELEAPVGVAATTPGRPVLVAKTAGGPDHSAADLQEDERDSMARPGSGSGEYGSPEPQVPSHSWREQAEVPRTSGVKETTTATTTTTVGDRFESWGVDQDPICCRGCTLSSLKAHCRLWVLAHIAAT